MVRRKFVVSNVMSEAGFHAVGLIQRDLLHVRQWLHVQDRPDRCEVFTVSDRNLESISRLEQIVGVRALTYLFKSIQL